MAAEIELKDGQYSFAYTGDAPWWGVGNGALPPDLSPEEFAKHANADWSVRKVPATYTVDGQVFDLGRCALLREGDNKLLDVVTKEWNEVQNSEAFEFFNDFIGAGEMTMETAGVLRGGQFVFALAKTKESFELFKHDKVDSYLLFTNPHCYGWSTSVSWSAIRVVCMNTLMASLYESNNAKDKIVKISHRKIFNADEVKKTMGMAKKKLEKYKEMAKFLGSKKAKGEDIVEYFQRIFPKQLTPGVKNERDELSKNAKLALHILDKQPGHEFAEGSWWQPFNAVTFMSDHSMGRTQDNRLFSAWYGDARRNKIKALNLAMDYAKESV